MLEKYNAKMKKLEKDKRLVDKHYKAWMNLDNDERVKISQEQYKLNLLNQEEFEYMKGLLSSLKVKGFRIPSLCDYQVIRLLHLFYFYNENQKNKYYNIVFLEENHEEGSIDVYKVSSGVYKLSALFENELHNFYKSIGSQNVNLDNCSGFKLNHDESNNLMSNLFDKAEKILTITGEELDVFRLEDIYCDEMDERQERKKEGEKISVINKGQLSHKFKTWENLEDKLDIFKEESVYHDLLLDYIYETYSYDIETIVIKEGDAFYSNTAFFKGFNNREFLFNTPLKLETYKEEGFVYSNKLGFRVRRFEFAER